MKEEKKQSAREDILKAVLEHIIEKGTPVTTIREIAKLANVNSAAISYYFGSKDNLILEASKYYYDRTAKLFEVLKDKSIEPKERIFIFLTKYTQNLLRYPGFLKVQMSEYIKEDTARPDLSAWMAGQMPLLKEAVKEAAGIQDEEVLFFKSIQIFSCIIYPFLLNKYGGAMGTWDYYDEEVRKRYIQTMLDGLL